MNKDVLVALIAKDVNELQVLTEGLDQMEAIPAPYLRLALDKSKALTTNIEALIDTLSRDAACYVQENAACCVQTEQNESDEETIRIAEEAARQAELDRIAEEQEALFRAEELERQRREEERRKAEAEIARQAAALEAARQAELAEKRRREEEEARLQEELHRQKEEQERQAEEEARRQAQLSIESIESIESIKNDSIESPVTTLAESIEPTESLADKLAKTADDTLASAINNKKIIDLKSSITLGDRFRFQRELFGGNGEKMNKAISDFNSFETMTEAQEYIAKNFVHWALDNETVSDFIQLLQRRYL